MYPKHVLEIMKAMSDGDTKVAQKKQKNITELVGVISSYGNKIYIFLLNHHKGDLNSRLPPPGNWVTTMKVAMNSGKINVGPVRSPLSPLSEKEVDSLLEKLKKAKSTMEK